MAPPRQAPDLARHAKHPIASLTEIKSDATVSSAYLEILVMLKIISVCLPAVLALHPKHHAFLTDLANLR